MRKQKLSIKETKPGKCSTITYFFVCFFFYLWWTEQVSLFVLNFFAFLLFVFLFVFVFSIAILFICLKQNKNTLTRCSQNESLVYIQGQWINLLLHEITLKKLFGSVQFMMNFWIILVFFFVVNCCCCLYSFPLTNNV